MTHTTALPASQPGVDPAPIETTIAPSLPQVDHGDSDEAGADQPRRSQPAGTAPRFFQVSLLKLVVMSLCSFGLYNLFWFYQHWRTIRNNQRRTVSPFWRAALAPLFCYALFREIGQSIAVGGLVGRLGPLTLALGYVVLNQVGLYLPSPAALIGLLGVLPLAIVQHHANATNALAVPPAPKNDRFTPGNYLAAIAGAMVWLHAPVLTLYLDVDTGRLEAPIMIVIGMLAVIILPAFAAGRARPARRHHRPSLQQPNLPESEGGPDGMVQALPAVRQVD